MNYLERLEEVLFNAIKKGNLEKVKKTVEKGADINSMNKEKGLL